MLTPAESAVQTRLNAYLNTLTPERPVPDPPTRYADADARYAAALTLVRIVDRQLERHTRHYRDGAGRIITSLDEAVAAILKGELK